MGLKVKAIGGHPFLVALNNVEAQDSATHGVVPLHKFPLGQSVERVWGDPDKPGATFVIRINTDAGYIVLPHTHLVTRTSSSSKASGRSAWAPF